MTPSHSSAHSFISICHSDRMHPSTAYRALTVAAISARRREGGGWRGCALDKWPVYCTERQIITQTNVKCSFWSWICGTERKSVCAQRIPASNVSHRWLYWRENRTEEKDPALSFHKDLLWPHRLSYLTTDLLLTIPLSSPSCPLYCLIIPTKSGTTVKPIPSDINHLTP